VLPPALQVLQQILARILLTADSALADNDRWGIGTIPFRLSLLFFVCATTTRRFVLDLGDLPDGRPTRSVWHAEET